MTQASTPYHVLSPTDMPTGFCYNDGKIALFDKVHVDFPLQAIQIGSVAMELCTRGTAQITINGREHTVKQNDLIFHTPESILENIKPDADFDIHGFAFSRDYAEGMSVMFGNQWNFRLLVDRYPVISFTDEEAALFMEYHDLFKAKLCGQPRKHAHELADALLRAFFYDFHDTAERFSKIPPGKYSSGERMFQEFTSLLSDTYPRPRSVSWYADQLHVTPKYLSSTVKEISGQTASAIIHRYITTDAAFLLRHTRKSIKEISNELDFPNISFFGKYIRRHLGQSPRQFRLSARIS